MANGRLAPMPSGASPPCRPASTVSRGRSRAPTAVWVTTGSFMVEGDRNVAMDILADPERLDALEVHLPG